MSQQNIEVMRTWIEAWNRRDIETMLAASDPEFEFRTSGVFPGIDPVYRGRAAYQAFYDEFVGTWESFSVSVDELRDCGERALMLGVFEGRARDGLNTRRQTAAVWTFRDGRALVIQNYGDWSQALEAVGLRE
jgi:ketosteroid isomerase-like protein